MGCGLDGGLGEGLGVGCGFDCGLEALGGGSDVEAAGCVSLVAGACAPPPPEQPAMSHTNAPSSARATTEPLQFMGASVAESS